MQLTPEEFMKKAVINETELVRDYQHFADHIADGEVANTFRQWALEDGFRADRIKELLEKKGHSIKYQDP
jgi:rubrerythrin